MQEVFDRRIFERLVICDSKVDFETYTAKKFNDAMFTTSVKLLLIRDGSDSCESYCSLSFVRSV